MELSVVVPVHNETDNVRPLIEEIDAALDPALAYEIVYVDDGSGDDTLAKLVALRAEFPRLRVLRHLRCCGQSTALRTGIRAAKGRVVATLDGDGQNNPADIPRLLAAWGELDGGAAGAMVAGYRKKRQDTEWRRLSSKIANGVRGSLLQDNTPTPAADSRCFRGSCSWPCRISTICTASCRPWPSGRAARWSRSRSITGPGCAASPNTALGTGCGWASGICSA